MRRLLEILALPKAWYRRSLARRMFLGEEPTVPDEESQSGDDIFVYSLLPEGSGFLVKPKFHYADFATKSGTCSRQSRGLVADTNRESLRHKSRRWILWFVFATSPRLCWELVPDFVADFVADFSMHCNGLNSIRATQTGLSRTCHELCCKHLGHVEMVCVHDFVRESRRNGIWV